MSAGWCVVIILIRCSASLHAGISLNVVFIYIIFLQHSKTSRNSVRTEECLWINTDYKRLRRSPDTKTCKMSESSKFPLNEQQLIWSQCEYWARCSVCAVWEQDYYSSTKRQQLQDLKRLLKRKHQTICALNKNLISCFIHWTHAYRIYSGLKTSTAAPLYHPHHL